MEHYEVRITPFAEKAIQEIGLYIAGNLRSPQTGIRMLSLIRREIEALDTMPARYPLTSEKPWHDQGIHRMSVKNFFVYYWINEDEKTVQIIHVLYARRDQKAQLSKLSDMISQ